MAQVVINRFGNVSGWSEIQWVLFGRAVEGLMELSFGDEVEKEAVMAAGDFPVGVGRGNYKATASATILSEEFNGLLASLPANTRLTDIPATDVPVLLVKGDRVVKHVIRNMEFTGATHEVKQGDKLIGIKVGLFTTHIDWNVT